jgi:hypothetical protein
MNLEDLHPSLVSLVLCEDLLTRALEFFKNAAMNGIKVYWLSNTFEVDFNALFE